MYWELGRQQAVRAGNWKLYRSGNADGEIDTVELFNLYDDPSETTNLAAERLDLLNEMLALAQRSRTPSALFPSVFDSETDVVPGGEPLQ
jgi:arylsulfatase A-like enzyme